MGNTPPSPSLPNALLLFSANPLLVCTLMQNAKPLRGKEQCSQECSQVEVLYFISGKVKEKHGRSKGLIISAPRAWATKLSMLVTASSRRRPPVFHPPSPVEGEGTTAAIFSSRCAAFLT